LDILIDAAYREKDIEALPLEELSVFVLSEVGKPDNTEVSISFVDDDEIASLNERYRGKTGPTDVLSFECDNEPLPEEAFDLGIEPVYSLGDIVIAVDVAERQTAIYGTSFEKEMSILTIHGLLHLCGYDHMTEEDAAIMEPLEDELLAKWEASRS
jgi:probable rRNA maturation factor